MHRRSATRWHEHGIPRAANALRALAAGAALDAEALELALASTLGGICLANAGLGPHTA